MHFSFSTEKDFQQKSNQKEDELAILTDSEGLESQHPINNAISPNVRSGPWNTTALLPFEVAVIPNGLQTTGTPEKFYYNKRESTWCSYIQ